MSRVNDNLITTIETRSEDVIREVYGDFSNIQLPINPAKIANRYGLTVFTSTFTDPSISGIYDKDKKEIHIARDEYLPRQLFTMAHELGHYFLHKQKQEVFYRQAALVLGGKAKVETEADWFASSLLMPRELLTQYWDITKNVEKLAELFGVSESAMRWRLHNMGLKKNATTQSQRF